MLAEADEVDARLVGDHGLFDHVAQDLVGPLGRAGLIEGNVAESIDAEFGPWGSPLAADMATNPRPGKAQRRRATAAGMRKSRCVTGIF